MSGELELSFCLIVRNEEAYLRRCVESFGSVPDELVIVDTGSKDRTEEIARSLLRDRVGRLERFEWCDDFAAARNHACSFARGEWILMVDGDEFLAPDQEPRVIIDAIRDAPPEISNLLLIDMTLIDGTLAMSHPVNRLFRNRPDVKWAGRIHETLTVASAATRQTQVRLIHDNARKREAGIRLPGHLSVMYERGLIADATADPTNPRHAFYLGNTLAERHDWEGALEAYARYFELSGSLGWNEEAAQAWINVSLCRRKLGRSDEARRALLEAIAIAPTRNEAHIGLGDLALERGRLEEARTWYQFATTLPKPQGTLFVDTLAYGARPWWKLSTALARAGDYRAARLAVQRAAAYAPDDPEVGERAVQLELALLSEDEAPTVVIPSRTPALAERCLEGMLENEGAVYYETVIVCDGGTAPFEPLLERFPRLRLIAGERPFIFSRNANLGIAAARGDVVLMNDDAQPASKGWLDVLRAVARGRPDAGPVSPLISRSGNTPQDAGYRDDRVDALEATQVTFVCVYLTRALLELVGPLDEAFVWYGWEDSDYCSRAAERGRKSLVAQRAYVRHDEPSSTFRSPSQMRHLVQGQKFFALKRRPPPPFDVLVLTRGDGGRGAAQLESIARLLEATGEDARFVILDQGSQDDAFIAGLRDLADPRLALRFEPRPIPESRILEELARTGGAQAIVCVAPEVLVPQGWLGALAAGRSHEIDGLGVLALLRRGERPARPSERIAGIDLHRDPEGAMRAAVRFVARRTLCDFSPLSSPSGPGDPWPRLIERLERRRRVSGFVANAPTLDVSPGRLS
jgi:glycosyltransferase involved in cell wall biosynthesis